MIPQNRDLRCAALAAAASTCGVSSPAQVVDAAKIFYDWLTESAPLPPPAFGFVEAAAGIEQGDKPIARREPEPQVSHWFSDVKSFCEKCDSNGVLAITMPCIFKHIGLPISETRNPTYTRCISSDLAVLGWQPKRTAKGRFYVKQEQTNA